MQRAEMICERLQVSSVEIHAMNADSGVAVITTQEEVARAEAAVCRLVDSCIDKYDRFVICAFSDPALVILQKKYGNKVQGIGYASIASAYTLSSHFAILTGQQSIVANTCRQVREYHREGHFDGVIVIDKSYAETLCKKEELYQLYLQTAREYILLHGTEVIVLGGAVFTNWSDALSRDLGIKVIEGLDAALEGMLV